MTPAAQHPQHCNHECVCMGMPNFYKKDEPCTKDKCKHDTRPHTPAAPAKQMSEAMGNLVKVACEQARKAEREQVLDEVMKKFNEINFDCYCPFSDDGESCEKYSFESCFICHAKHITESLRGGATEQISCNQCANFTVNGLASYYQNGECGICKITGKVMYGIYIMCNLKEKQRGAP